MHPSQVPSPMLMSAPAQVLDFPGARFSFVNELHVVPEATPTPIPCYRVLDELGQLIPGAKYAEVSSQDVMLLRLWKDLALFCLSFKSLICSMKFPK